MLLSFSNKYSFVVTRESRSKILPGMRSTLLITIQILFIHGCGKCPLFSEASYLVKLIFDWKPKQDGSITI